MRTVENLVHKASNKTLQKGIEPSSRDAQHKPVNNQGINPKTINPSDQSLPIVQCQNKEVSYEEEGDQAMDLSARQREAGGAEQRVMYAGNLYHSDRRLQSTGQIHSEFERQGRN